jgi:hypothetical protein
MLLAEKLADSKRLSEKPKPWGSVLLTKRYPWDHMLALCEILFPHNCCVLPAVLYVHLSDAMGRGTAPVNSVLYQFYDLSCGVSSSSPVFRKRREVVVTGTTQRVQAGVFVSCTRCALGSAQKWQAWPLLQQCSCTAKQ